MVPSTTIQPHIIISHLYQLPYELWKLYAIDYDDDDRIDDDRIDDDRIDDDRIDDDGER
jgi:hypothetical protein